MHITLLKFPTRIGSLNNQSNHWNCVPTTDRIFAVICASTGAFTEPYFFIYITEHHAHDKTIKPLDKIAMSKCKYEWWIHSRCPKSVKYNVIFYRQVLCTPVLHMSASKFQARESALKIPDRIKSAWYRNNFHSLLTDYLKNYQVIKSKRHNCKHHYNCNIFPKLVLFPL